MIKQNKKKPQAFDRNAKCPSPYPKTVTLCPLYLNDEDGLYGSEN